MKKLLLGLLIAVLPSSISLMAQNNVINNQEATRSADKVTRQDADVSATNRHGRMAVGQRQAAGVTTIWSENFSGGIPSSWMKGGTVNGIDTAHWEYRGPGTNPDITQGSRGSCGGEEPIESPTASNGFVIFDSNWWDDPGSLCGGNVGSGLVPNPHFSYLITDAIDCSLYGQLRLEWYQRIRHFSSIPAVLVSSDGGATFDTIYDARDFYDPNEAGPLDDYVSLDVSNLVGGSNNVVIKFSWSPSGRIPAYNGYYYWQIDDIRLVERPDNDLAILPNTQYITQLHFDDRVGIYAYILPNQITDVVGAAVVQNKGKVDQPNVKVNFSASGAGTFNQDSPTLSVLEVDSLALLTNETNPFNPTAKGLYDFTMEVSSDSTDIDPDPFRPNDNIFTTDFAISDSVMGLARKGVSTASIRTSTEWGGGIGIVSDGIILGNFLELTVTDTITSVSIGLSTITRPGGTVRITVRDTIGDFNNILLESDYYTITLQDSINHMATIGIPAVLPNSTPQDRELSPNWYLLAVELYSSGNTADIGILDDGTVPQRADMSLMFLPGPDTWYTNGNAHHIWANFGPTPPVGLQGIDSKVNLRLTPNPAKDVVTLRAFTEKSVNFQVVITNISGETVKTESFGKKQDLTANINISDLPAGVYVVKVKAGEESVVRKLVIQ